MGPVRVIDGGPWTQEEEARCRHVEMERYLEAMESGNRLRIEKRTVLWEDDAFLAVYKPAGVYAGTTPINTERSNMFSCVRQYIGSLSPWAQWDDVELRQAHRLDRDTSGVLLFAKTKAACAVIPQLLSSDYGSTKEYRCLLLGDHREKDRISVHTGHARSQKGKFSVYKLDDVGEKVANGEPVRFASSMFEKLSSLSPNLSFWAVSIDTGRTHQIRLHAAASLGLPILGDVRYGSQRAHSHTFACPFHFLHCHRVQFRHPMTQRMISIEAPIPRSWTRFMH